MANHYVIWDLLDKKAASAPQTFGAALAQRKRMNESAGETRYDVQDAASAAKRQEVWRRRACA